MKKQFWLFASLVLLKLSAYAQEEKVEGQIFEANSNGEELGLSGANVYWLNSPIGTITDEDGFFSIPFLAKYNQLVVSYIGFETDTVFIDSPTKIKLALKPSNQLDEVVVQDKRESLEKSYFSAQNVVTVGSEELLKAACCNLSESFETNPSIDVNFNDAITGTKQIEMLGLTSPYILITQENIPMVRGASQTFGLTFTPGTWVESIQITKGMGSVINGYESISGQINTELVKPLSDVPLFVNLYGNRNGRLELNTHLNTKLSNKWSTGLYIHTNRRDVEVDNNEDGFLDAPLANQINVLSRWQYQNPETGWVSFLNLRYLTDSKQLGQEGFDPENRANSNLWGSEITTNRFDSSIKLGYVFPDLPFQSFGFQASYSLHDQDSYYGLNQYNIEHQSVYSNLLFNSIIGNTQHKFKTGLTLAIDDYDELVNNVRYTRTDGSFGAFFEYAYTNLEKLSLTAGLRFDSHNRLGEFFTPRLHIRYTPWERASLRGSFGMGRRAANIFAENQRMFASSRRIELLGNGGSIYGFEPEKATNFGLSFLQGFTFLNRQGDFSVDFYRTNFENQIVVDWENAEEVVFSNLEGESYANSLQIELSHEILERFKVRAAYKFYDVKTTYQTGLLQKPLLAKNRFFANLEYQTKIKNNTRWKFDYTIHAVGQQRLPNSEANPAATQLGEFADAYVLMNSQVTREFSPKFEMYVGGENLTGFTQNMPIIGANNPFGTNFDTTIVYGPIMGRMVYAGLRYKIL